MTYESKLSEWLCFGETEDEANDLSESGRVTAEAPSAGRGEGHAAGTTMRSACGKAHGSTELDVDSAGR